jgi:hypothetical protein
LSKFYPGFMPWDLERMSLREVIKYVRYMDASLAAGALPPSL